MNGQFEVHFILFSLFFFSVLDTAASWTAVKDIRWCQLVTFVQNRFPLKPVLNWSRIWRSAIFPFKPLFSAWIATKDLKQRKHCKLIRRTVKEWKLSRIKTFLLPELPWHWHCKLVERTVTAWKLLAKVIFTARIAFRLTLTSTCQAHKKNT